jgi:Ca-activated chloride channel family protein
MDKTQAFDPNRTVIGGGDMNRTQAMSGPLSAGDPNRTTAFTPPSAEMMVTITPSRSATMANGPAREQYLLELVAPGDSGGLSGFVAQGTRTPLNLCLVIDRSGSMEGPPMEYVKQACAHVVDLLSPNDVLSIVVFDEIVEVLMAPQRVTNKEPIKQGIQQLQPGYTTNLYDGITLGAQQLQQLQDPGRATRMIVFSDGDPTAGIKDFASLVQHAGQTRQSGISITFLGFGQEYNEELLAAMAKKAGGNYYYIAQPHLIPEVFRAELEKMMTISSTQARLEIKLARWVDLKGMTGHSPVPGQREVVLDLADLERGAMMQIVVDLEFQNHPLGHYRVGAGKLTWTDSASGSPRTQDLDFIMEFTADQARFSAPVDPRVASAAQVSLVSKAVEKTIMGLKTMAITTAQAVQDLQRTQALLVSEGRTSEAREVTLAMQAIQRGDTGGAEKTLMGAVVQLDQGKKSN